MTCTIKLKLNIQNHKGNGGNEIGRLEKVLNPKCQESTRQQDNLFTFKKSDYYS